jgi:hypothetical protein
LVTTYMQHTKLLFDELAVTGWPLSLEDFNLYLFNVLRGELKDLVASLVTKAEPLSYVNPHNHLLTHEFLHKSSLPSLAGNPPLLPSTHLAQLQHNSNFGHNKGRSRDDWRSNNNRYNNHDKSNFQGFHSSVPMDWKQSHW